MMVGSTRCLLQPVRTRIGLTADQLQERKEPARPARGRAVVFLQNKLSHRGCNRPVLVGNFMYTWPDGCSSRQHDTGMKKSRR